MSEPSETNVVQCDEAELHAELVKALAILSTFRPITVDLRIDGVVRPVTLFARDETPALRVV